MAELTGTIYNMKKICFATLLFISSGYCGLSQTPENGKNGAWNEGSITLDDETTLHGIMYYNTVNGVVLFRTSLEDPDTQTIYTSNIAYMNYMDAFDGTNKKFSSMAFTDPETKKEEIYFYEILKEFKDFVVLSKKDQLKTEVSSFQHSYSAVPKALSSHLTTVQSEEIYFVGTEGRLEKYLSLSYKKASATVYGYRSEKAKFYDRSLFPKYLHEYWKPVEKYLKDNHIELNRKENIVRGLNYYESLIQK